MKTTKAKTWVAAVGLVVTALSAAFADDVFNAGEVANVITALVTGAGSVYAVYKVPNKPTGNA